MAIETTLHKIRRVIRGIGADRVRRQASGQWDALWYQHPHNHGSNGHYVLIGLDDDDAVDYLRSYNSWANAQF